LLALASTTLTKVAYLRGHDAADALPALSLRQPFHSAEALIVGWLGAQYARERVEKRA
jgi:hypothetical protein